MPCAMLARATGVMPNSAAKASIALAAWRTVNTSGLLRCTASARLDDQALHQRIALGDIVKGFESRAPKLVGVAVGGQRHNVENREQTETVKLGRHAMPFIGAVARQIIGRVGTFLLS